PWTSFPAQSGRAKTRAARKCAYTIARQTDVFECSRPKSATQRAMLRGGRNRLSPARECMAESTSTDTLRTASGATKSGRELGTGAAEKEHSLQMLHLPGPSPPGVWSLAA